mmetsp:Transcript_16250/g.35561  ORF Transcript_16250/g.35561 Transcript_16250/m.35561 type:complete len:410 (-) Transcript_16250:155-1384(-)
MAAMKLEDFSVKKHAIFFQQQLEKMPEPYKTMDVNRLTLLYFCISGLDLLGALDSIDKERIIRFIYSYQSDEADSGGFYGYPLVHCSSAADDTQPHIANTYVALVMLVILGDDLSRVRRDAVAASMRKWQLPDGSFCCVHGMSSLDSENDMRFVFCAAAICYMLDLWHAVDLESMLSFILISQSYDSGFGMGPQTESHGGCTYCALAALSMMGKLGELPGKDELINWCTKRQLRGFQGRVEKEMDSCYSFWVGGSLNLLGAGPLLESENCARFLKDCESEMGGFQKFPHNKFPDLLHSYMSVCGLSLCGLLPPLNVLLNMSERAFSSAAHRFRMAPGGRCWEPPLAERMREGSRPSRTPRALDGTTAAMMEEKSWNVRSLPMSFWAVLVLALAALLPRLLQLLYRQNEA